MLVWFSVAVLVLLPPTSSDGAGDDGPRAHWPLDGSTLELRSGREAVNHGVRFTPGGPRGAKTAAAFDGRAAYLEVPESQSLRPGRSDFTLSLWVETSADLDDDPGDLVTLDDPERRVGLWLSLRTSSGVTSNQANFRQLQFGLDADTEPRWADAGRPGDALLAFALATHDGALYAGTCSNAEGGVGRIHRFEAPGQWTDLGPLDGANAVSALAEHGGSLYAGTARYRFGGSSLPESPNANPGGSVFRLEADGRWVSVGKLAGIEAIGGLVSFQGRLHASSLYAPAGFFRLEPDGTWTRLPVPDGKRVEPLAVHDGALYAGSYDGARVYRYDGQAWTDLGAIAENTQTYSFATYRNRLHVGTWPSGRVYRLEGASWIDMGRLGEELEVMGMLVHNGRLYGGTLPLADVYRLDEPGGWTRVGRLDGTPDVKYRRAWTMAEHRGKLYCSTLPSGKVWRLEAGPAISFDRAFPPGWRHVAAVKQADRLRLYVDGVEVAVSEPFDTSRYNLDPAGPLCIGCGAGGTFHGRISGLRLDLRALTAAEVAALAAP